MRTDIQKWNDRRHHGRNESSNEPLVKRRCVCCLLVKIGLLFKKDFWDSLKSSENNDTMPRLFNIEQPGWRQSGVIYEASSLPTRISSSFVARIPSSSLNSSPSYSMPT